MKKVLAIVLALVMALSCSAMAFATSDDAVTTTAAATTAATTAAAPATTTTGELVAATVTDILGKIVDLAKAGMSQWNDVESIVLKILELLEGAFDAIAGERLTVLLQTLRLLFPALSFPVCRISSTLLRKRFSAGTHLTSSLQSPLKHLKQVPLP